jgi:DNA-binding SARP family transcriptional activator
LSYILCIASSLACGKQRSFNLQFAEWERSANQTFAWERPVQLLINALFLKTNQKAGLALAAIGDALQPTANLQIPFLEALIQLAKSTLVFSQGKTQEAFKALEAAERIANELESDLLRFNALMARACMEIRGAPDPGANETLRAALSLGKRKDLFEVFFGDRQDLKELCIQALELEVETDYVYHFIKHFRMSSHGVPVHLDNWPWFLKVFTLGHFSVVKEGQVLKTGRKAQRKPLQLLRVLLAFGGIRVEEEQILDALWPEAEGDSAHRSFTITLHRLRKLLGGSKVVELRNGCVTLAKEFCWVDAWAFESLTAKAETLWKTAQTEVDITRAIDTSRKAMALYRGSFFFSPHAQPWSLVSRDRFRRKYTHLVSILGEHWQRCSCMDLAVECYQRSIEEDPIDEEPYGQLMKCYHRMGRNEKALAVYNRLCTFLSSALGIEPSHQMKKLKISIQNESAS